MASFSAAGYVTSRDTGALSALAGCRVAAACARKPCGGAEAPRFDDYDALLAAHPAAAAQCYNRVKACAACGKVCAASLATCNGCGASLGDVEVSRSPNVFMGFVHGVARSSFPLRISTRYEDASTLVFDDPLALAGCHVCAIPTDVYAADAAALFASPARGAALLRRLEAAAWRGVSAQFLDDDAWRARTYGTPAPDRAALRAAAVAGLNVPPSQFQLHLQFLLPPLLPRQLQLYRAGAHFTRHRFLPLDYVLDALDALAARGVSLDAAGLDGAALVARVAEHCDADYDASWRRCYDGVAAAQEALGRYALTDFAYAVRDAGGAVEALGAGAAGAAEEAPPDAKALADADKKALGSYDRNGTYYGFPKAPPLPAFVDGA